MKYLLIVAAMTLAARMVIGTGQYCISDEYGNLLCQYNTFDEADKACKDMRNCCGVEKNPNSEGT